MAVGSIPDLDDSMALGDNAGHANRRGPGSSTVRGHQHDCGLDLWHPCGFWWHVFNVFLDCGLIKVLGTPKKG